MVRERETNGSKSRLDAFINLAHSGRSIQLHTRLYRKLYKQVGRSNATDDIDIEKDVCLLMADFTSEMSAQDMPEKVTKAYMICPVNDIEINETTALHIANDRLRMDYARLREANITFEENYF